MKLAADTGAVLSISCSAHAGMLFREHQVIITPGVHEELEQFARYDDLLGKKAKEALKRKLPVLKPKQLLVLSLDAAEKEVVSLSKEQRLLCLTDDIRAARLAWEKHRITTRPSFYLLLLLYKKKRVSQQELIKDMQAILKYRNWLSGALWEYAMGEIEKLPP